MTLDPGLVKASKETLNIYYVHQYEQSKTLRLVAPLLSKNPEDRTVRYFSSWGRSLSPTTNYKPCAHFLTPLDRSSKRALVLKRALPLPSASAVAPVLAQMLRAMGNGSEILLQTDRSWIDPDAIGAALPSVECQANPSGAKGWLRLTAPSELEADIRSLSSIYPLLAPKLDDFRAVLADAGDPSESPESDYLHSAENEFIYSLKWSLHTRAILESLFRRYGLESSLRGLDVGGGYGFLACELAAMGHRMTNLELLDWKVNTVLPWLAKTSGTSERVDGWASRMEDLTGVDETFDFVCFMGSLLFIERSDVTRVLATARRLLKPGGLLVFRENLLIDATRDQHRTGRYPRFRPQELHEILCATGDRPVYLDHWGVERSPREIGALRMLFAALEKNSSRGTKGTRQDRRGLLHRLLDGSRRG